MAWPGLGWGGVGNFLDRALKPPAGGMNQQLPHKGDQNGDWKKNNCSIKDNRQRESPFRFSPDSYGTIVRLSIRIVISSVSHGFILKYIN